MESLKIVWKRRAIQQANAIACWYETYCGSIFATKFVQTIHDTTRLLAKIPTIGVQEQPGNKSKKPYYSFLAHPKYRVVYSYNSRTLYIICFRATQRMP